MDDDVIDVEDYEVLDKKEVTDNVESNFEKESYSKKDYASNQDVFRGSSRNDYNANQDDLFGNRVFFSTNPITGAIGLVLVILFAISLILFM